jgi:crotonobetainyl-CoA:carnitine CoA-transferase CaiB-like acyl-CoA transferase
MIPNGALSGIRVLDFSTLLPGPMATLFLSEAGAEVIKVERPGKGEEMRTYTPRWGTDSVNFAMLNRGKKSIAVDLKDLSERERLIPLLQSCDIIVEQFRPGVLARLGLGYSDVARINPKVIYCSITGYGQTGPKHAVAGHDLNYIGDAGLLSLSLGDPQKPVIPPALIADIAGGSYPAIINILLALRQRELTGTGAYLDISMAENLFPFIYWAMGDGQATGSWPGSGDALVTGGSCRYRLYPSADQRFVAVAALEQKFWERFVEAIGLPPKFHDDAADPVNTAKAVAELIASKTSDHWTSVFEKADCCCSVVKSVKEALDDPHFAARSVFSAELVNESEQPIRALPTPIVPQFRHSSSAAAPRLGQDNANFLAPKRNP